MKINETIKKYRKQKSLTQEQIANYLGVTAPAVNKWENGISYPDITLLAPLCRILDINIDTLLSFNEELSDKEINDYILDISKTTEEHGFEEGFSESCGLIKKYPNCDKLTLFIAQIMNAQMTIHNIQDKEKYHPKIKQWLETVAAGKDKDLASMAISSLVSDYITKEDYVKAQELLDQIPNPGYDKKPIQASLYVSQGKMDEAYKTYEEIIFKNINETVSTLHVIISSLCRENKYDDALIYADIAEKVSELFDLGAYSACIPQLMLSMTKHEKDSCLAAIEKMVNGIETRGNFSHSKLYRHMKFKDMSNPQNLKNMIRRALENDETLDFIKDDSKFKNLIEKLK